MKKIFIIFMAAIVLNATVSAKEDIRFDKIETTFQINTFIQDRDGFFWLGSTNGLYQYDGYTCSFS
ncbi:hypothetical protein QUF80_10710 [Desulfococcaceae bacterium HSG8]|nr:hypothetical protein [Desulfococcaceae bacterium HSG8]